MMENKKEYYSIHELIGILKNYVFSLSKKWLLLMIFFLIGAGLGVLYFNIQKPKYSASAVFILEEKSLGGGGLSGIASQFGIDIGMLGGGASNIFSGENIFEILKSKKIVNTVLLSNLNEKENTKLIDTYISDYNTTKKWNSTDEFRNVNFNNADSGLNSLQDSVLNIVYDKIINKHLSIEKPNKKGSLIEVTVTSKNRDFSKILCTRMIEEAKKLYMQIKTNTAVANINRLQFKADSILNLLNRKSFQVAGTQLIDANAGIRSSVVPAEIASRDRTILATIYTEVVKNLETSKMLLAQQTPIIQLIDVPEKALYDNKLSLPVSILLFGFGFLVIGIVSLTLIMIMRNG